ncbi:cell division protein FtsK [Catellatospora methionotrophica]|uniref:Cell division protein FtsK n=1 Tax=Catellatospora methionotrophica TaxID=121620 RepID=A0A8J3L8N6_9ACTN|nr:AAA family ATPase [Catellatospora methionotrophica]GIG13753.1 cell division protein FtsK [Catellatospora methionotrophica]
MAITPIIFNSNEDDPTRPAAPDQHGPADAESYTVYRPDQGAPVDAPEEAELTLTWADATSGDARRRVPLVPTWMLSAHTRRATVRALVDDAGYYAAFHALRAPKYGGRVLLYAPRGAFRLARRVLRWASAEEGNWGLRQHAASKADAYTWQALNRTRSKESKPRWMLLGAASLAMGVGAKVLEVSGVVPPIGWYAAAVGAVAVAAQAGKPADAPITDRVSDAPKFVRLTAEQVRAALVSLRLAGLTDGGQVEFPSPIHRDGPGWLARVNLPLGIEAVKAIEKRAALSSALRLPVDQVWPTAGPEHAGQLDLWVGYQPASKMGTPRWSLLADNAVTSVFTEEEFGSDERQRPVKTSGFARSFLLGGQPGSGKSYAARALGLVFALDPTVEFKIAEFKGTGDFIDFEPLCSTYVVGVDDEAIRQGAAILTWALGEAERRGKRILAAKQAGHAPEGKVTPELARKKGSGLHPIVILIDEAHELFAADKDAADAAERLIKRARALNIIVILATQIPDKNSLPPNITRCVTNRWCLSVAGQVENDMILGTGAYKRGITGTVYRPVVDAGWGVMTGGPAPTSVRSQYPTPDQAAAILARAVALRGGRRPIGTDLPAARDLVADLHDVSADNGQHWSVAAPALTERWPNAYPTLTAEALSDMARGLGVTSQGVKVAGRVLKGYRRDELTAILAQRGQS